jgi:DNA polymerase III subunit delta
LDEDQCAYPAKTCEGAFVKYSNLPAFEKHLESAAPNHFADIYCILAKEPFIRKRATDRLAELLLKHEASPELALHVFDGEKHAVENVLRELEATSFFSKKRLIILHNADAYDKASTLKLEAYCSSPNRSVCFAAAAGVLNRATTFYKKLEKTGVVLDVAEEKPWEREKSVADWLHQEAAREGKQLGPQVAQMLVKQLGTDQMLLLTELQKLVCYVGERKMISDKDVAAISSAVNVENGWQLGEAIFRRDAAAALRISKGLLLDGTAIIALLRQVRSQFQTEFQVCSILMQGGTAAEVSKEFPYMRGTILDRHVQQSQAYGMTRFKQGILAIDEAEIQAKNSNIDPEFLAERLIIKLTI